MWKRALPVVLLALGTWVLWDSPFRWASVYTLGVLAVGARVGGLSRQRSGRTSGQEGAGRGSHGWRFARASVRTSLAFVVAIGVLLFQSFLVYQFAEAPLAPPGTPVALWIRHAWVDRLHPADEYRRLADLLERRRITDVFAHV